MVLVMLRRCEVLGLRFADMQVADRRLVMTEGKGGHYRDSSFCCSAIR